MTEKEYRKHPAISRSELWRLHESPEKFKYYRENPQPPSPALIFGQVVHKLLLQPEDFDSDFAVAPDVDRRTKEGREIYKEFLEFESAAEKTIITTDQFELAGNMVEKALAEPFVKKLLDGQREKPFFWTDDMTGEDCKCRADCVTEIGGKLIVIDYKSTTDASNDGFQSSALRYGYTFQAGMYLEGICKNTLGRPLIELMEDEHRPMFVFIVQEKNPPYALNVFQADKAFVQNGYDQYREFLGMYHYCKGHNDWYGFLGKEREINTLSLPAWMLKE